LEDSSEKEKMSKDDFDNIHQIVGQTRLLCQDKLGKQFRNLCLKTLVRSIEVFRFRGLNIKAIDAVFPISIAFFLTI